MTAVAGLGRIESDVFLSYRREQAAAADRIDEVLTAANLSVWMDRTALTPGRPWSPAIELAVQEAAVFVAVTDPSYRQSSACLYELSLAVREGKQIVCAGESPWEWIGCRPPPRSVVVPAGRPDAVFLQVAERLDLGRRQARLQAAVRRPLEVRPPPAVRATLDDLRAAGLPTTQQMIEVGRRQAARPIRRRAAALAAALALVAGLTWGLFAGAANERVQAAAGERDRAAQARAAADQAVRTMTAQGVQGWAALPALRQVVAAYDQTPAVADDLRQALRTVGQHAGLRAARLPSAVVAARLDGQGHTWGLSRDGTVVEFDATGRETYRRTLPVAGPLAYGLVAPDGAGALTGTVDGTVQRWSLPGGSPQPVPPVAAGPLTTDDALSRLASAHGHRLEVRRMTGSLLCASDRPAPVTALAMTPDASAVAVGDERGIVTVLDTSRCAASAALPYPPEIRRHVAIDHISISNRARAVGFASGTFGGVARLDLAGRYRSDGIDESQQSAFSPDATATVSFGDAGASVSVTADGRPDTGIDAPVPDSERAGVTTAAVARHGTGWDVAFGLSNGTLLTDALPESSCAVCADPDPAHLRAAAGQVLAVADATAG